MFGWLKLRPLLWIELGHSSSAKIHLRFKDSSNPAFWAWIEAEMFEVGFRDFDHASTPFRTRWFVDEATQSFNINTNRQFSLAEQHDLQRQFDLLVHSFSFGNFYGDGYNVEFLIDPDQPFDEVNAEVIVQILVSYVSLMAD